MSGTRLQRTISRPVAVHGYGFWSGEPVRVQFRPAAIGAGVTFVRDDLDRDACVPARAEYRLDVPRRTNLRRGEVQVDMVEHVLAALAGLQIDNCEVGVDAVEMPGCDGSSRAFVEALDRAGIEQQDALAAQLRISETVRLESGESWIEARPASDDDARVEFRLEYPRDTAIGRQSVSVGLTPDTFREELASSRTFILKHEADALVEQGLGKHVTPQDLLVFGNQGPIDNRLRFANECARHKALDLVGDLSLTGHEIIGHVVAYRSGHQLNAALAAALLSNVDNTAHLKATA